MAVWNLSIRDNFQAASMADRLDHRGVLHPARLGRFVRFAPRHDVREHVAWFWLAQWDIAAGRSSRQQLLPFPLMNLVVQSEGVTLSGPSTGPAHRDLVGRGWAVAAVLRPAAGAALCSRPAALLDRELTLEAPQLHEQLKRQHAATEPDMNHQAVTILEHWLAQQLPPPDEMGLLANLFIELVAGSPGTVRVEQAARDLAISVRSLQRLSIRYLGLPPMAVIRRYRLQDAAQMLRENRRRSIARIAAELDSADQAHLASDFRKVLGFSPSTYREDSGRNEEHC